MPSSISGKVGVRVSSSTPPSPKRPVDSYLLERAPFPRPHTTSPRHRLPELATRSVLVWKTASHRRDLARDEHRRHPRSLEHLLADAPSEQTLPTDGAACPKDDG